MAGLCPCPSSSLQTDKKQRVAENAQSVSQQTRACERKTKEARTRGGELRARSARGKCKMSGDRMSVKSVIQTATTFLVLLPLRTQTEKQETQKRGKPTERKNVHLQELGRFIPQGVLSLDFLGTRGGARPLPPELLLLSSGPPSPSEPPLRERKNRALTGNRERENEREMCTYMSWGASSPRGS